MSIQHTSQQHNVIPAFNPPIPSMTSEENGHRVNGVNRPVLHNSLNLVTMFQYCKNNSY